MGFNSYLFNYAPQYFQEYLRKMNPQKSLNIAIFGAGALGSLVGAYLSSHHHVTLYGRPAHMDAIRENGVQISGINGQGQYSPRAVSEIKGEHFDLVILGVKAYDTKNILALLHQQDIAFTYISSLQNGLKDDYLMERFGLERVLGCVIDEAVRIISPGHIFYSNRGASFFGTYPAETSLEKMAVAESITTALCDYDIIAGTSTNMDRLTWYKFMTAVPGLAVCGAFDVGKVQALTYPSVLEFLLRAFDETAKVTLAGGIEVEEHPLLHPAYVLPQERHKKWFQALGEKLFKSGDSSVPSLVQDLRAGKSTTESEEVIGKMLSLAQQRGIPAAALNYCYNSIKAREIENQSQRRTK